MNVEELLSRLHGVVKSGAGSMALCPAHADKNPSLSVDVRDGKILVHCHAGCAMEAVLALIGVEKRDLFLDRGGMLRIVAEYDYTDETGDRLFQVVRADPKDFRQRRRSADGGWIWNLKGVRRVLYRLPEVSHAPIVLVCEGEKDCETARGLDLVATCNPGGAGKWREEYSELLRGKDVAIIADADEPGRKHAAQVAASIAGKAKSVKMLELPGAKDLSEWIENDGTREALVKLIDDTSLWNPADVASPESRAEQVKPHSVESQEAQSREEIQREIENLSTLDPIAYDRVREAKASEFGIRVSTLDAEVLARRNAQSTNASDGQGQDVFLCDPKPWEGEVIGDTLLQELEDTVLKYLTVPKGTAETLALWMVFSHAHDAFQISPLLAVTSPEKGCGKSTVLTLLSGLTRRPLFVSNITTSSLFRAVEMFSPTLLIDEADTFISENEELRGVINSGWLRSQARIIRTVGNDYEPRLFSTWGPKVIAAIGTLPGTLADRSVEVRMCRQTPEEAQTKEKLRADRVMSELAQLCRKIWCWAQNNLESLRRADPEVPEGFANRLADNWRPLFAVADIAGGQWPRKARTAATALSVVRTDESFGVMLLEDLSRLFTDQNVDRLSSAAIVEALVGMDDRPWPEYSHGKPITKHGLAKILARYRVYPDSVRIDGKILKGYLVQDFEEAFRRFSPSRGSQTETTERAAQDAASAYFQTVTPDNPVPDQDSRKPASNKACSAVTVTAAEGKGRRVLEGEVRLPPRPLWNGSKSRVGCWP